MRGDATKYWRANLRILGLLLAVWFVASFGLGILFAEPLNAVRMGGFPLGFWFAQQGAIYIFIVLILIYARLMDRVDARFAVEAPPPPPAPPHDLHEPLEGDADG